MLENHVLIQVYHPKNKNEVLRILTLSFCSVFYLTGYRESDFSFFVLFFQNVAQLAARNASRRISLPWRPVCFIIHNNLTLRETGITRS
jgi:hypothetical protein